MTDTLFPSMVGTWVTKYFLHILCEGKAPNFALPHCVSIKTFEKNSLMNVDFPMVNVVELKKESFGSCVNRCYNFILFAWHSHVTIPNIFDTCLLKRE